MNSATNQVSGKNESAQDRAVIVLQVDNVDEVYLSLGKKGVNFLAEPKSMLDWGIRALHFRDPEDNLIELYSELGQEAFN